MSIFDNDDDDEDYTFGGALPAIDVDKEDPEGLEVVPADVYFPLEEIKTSPELKAQLQKNIAISKDTVAQASSILQELTRRSSTPPKG